ncbi:MAG: hypothetical protein IPM60_06210 [Rhodospirillales bacterium]|nr:hypothetical protein [Rhodospirillales bacterium]
MASDTKLAQLLVSRLCHDLVGPAGALANGVDLLKELGGDGEIVDLIAASAGRLAHQLDFFRVAFGLRGGDDPHSGWDEARRLAAGIVDGTRIGIDWPDGAGDAPVPAAALRLVLCLVLVARDALPRSGTITVRIGDARGSAGSGLNAIVCAHGERVVLNDDLVTALEARSQVDEVSPRTVHGDFAARLARSLGAVITLDRPSAGEARLSLSGAVDPAQ